MHFHIKFVAKTCIRDVCFPSCRLPRHIFLFFEKTNTGCEQLLYNDGLYFASHIIADPIDTEVA